jgi:hypothetical protein
MAAFKPPRRSEAPADPPRRGLSFARRLSVATLGFAPILLKAKPRPIGRLCRGLFCWRAFRSRTLSKRPSIVVRADLSLSRIPGGSRPAEDARSAVDQYEATPSLRNRLRYVRAFAGFVET